MKNDCFNFDWTCVVRHEYLGPAPYVAGYQFSEERREAKVEWWDNYLDKTWMGKETWRFEMCFDETVEGWVSRPRGDRDDSLDMKEYIGPG